MEKMLKENSGIPHSWHCYTLSHSELYLSERDKKILVSDRLRPCTCSLTVQFNFH